MFGIVSPKFLWKNIRYAILAVFLVAAIICPSPDPGTMCIYAVPMLGALVVGIAVAWWVHPSRRRKEGGGGMSFSWFWTRLSLLLSSIILSGVRLRRIEGSVVAFITTRDDS